MRITITLKSKHHEELGKLQEALGGVSASNAIAFLLQSTAPKIVSALQQSPDFILTSALTSTETRASVPVCTQPNISAPISTEVHASKLNNSFVKNDAESALNNLLGI